jgi:rod shape-determining protein MreC
MYRREISAEKKIFVFVMFLFLNLILISTNVVLKNKKTLFQNVISLIVSPFQVGFQKTVDFVSHELNHYVFLKDSFKKYHKIKKKQFQLKYENYLLRSEIIRLKSFTNVKMESQNYIESDLIAVDRDFPFNSVMINKGSKDGIGKNMVVLNTNAELVGRIVEPITMFSSKVRLITNSIGGVGAYIKKEHTPKVSFLEGLLTGNNNKICSFKYLIENKPVEVGDRVFSSGTDRIFSSFIPIGVVVGIEKEYLTQKIYVEPFFIKKSIKHLIVVKYEQKN